MAMDARHKGIIIRVLVPLFVIGAGLIAIVQISCQGEGARYSPKTPVTRKEFEAVEELVHSIEAEYQDYELLPGYPAVYGKMVVAVRDGQGRTLLEHSIAFDENALRMISFNISRHADDDTESIPSDYFAESVDELETLILFYPESEDTGRRYTDGSRAYRSHYYAVVINVRDKTRYEPQFVVTAEPPRLFRAVENHPGVEYGVLESKTMVDYVRELTQMSPPG
ncbi:MAG: hypothetical protein QM270_06095 [Bacillota bacterium]|nr:hypothetical protein [Bacillota bacterium]